MAKREWQHMDADEKIEVLRSDNKRLFDLTNIYERDIERLQQRLSAIDSFLERLPPIGS
jgi:hypothetical protein